MWWRGKKLLSLWDWCRSFSDPSSGPALRSEIFFSTGEYFFFNLIRKNENPKREKQPHRLKSDSVSFPFLRTSSTSAQACLYNSSLTCPWSGLSSIICINHYLFGVLPQKIVDKDVLQLGELVLRNLTMVRLCSRGGVGCWRMGSSSLKREAVRKCREEKCSQILFEAAFVLVPPFFPLCFFNGKEKVQRKSLQTTSM